MVMFRPFTALGYIPLPWTAVRVIFIPKPGHNNTYVQDKSFHPISLTSYLLETLGRLVD
jgi:hypothetical protein